MTLTLNSIYLLEGLMVQAEFAINYAGFSNIEKKIVNYIVKLLFYYSFLFFCHEKNIANLLVVR